MPRRSIRDTRQTKSPGKSPDKSPGKTTISAARVRRHITFTEPPSVPLPLAETPAIADDSPRRARSPSSIVRHTKPNVFYGQTLRVLRAPNIVACFLFVAYMYLAYLAIYSTNLIPRATPRPSPPAAPVRASLAIWQTVATYVADTFLSLGS